MKIFPLILLWISLSTIPVWITDFNVAKQEAEKNNKLILLNFSGSDWCLPCIRMKKDVFDKEEFLQYASDNLVLVNADFPRQHKNKIPAEIKHQNEMLAEKYNPSGIFPMTLLLTPDGKEVRRWEGFESISPNQFIEEIKTASVSWKIN
jgi:thioredoxin-related protein